MVPEFKYHIWIEPLDLAAVRGSTLYVRAPEHIRTSVAERYLPLLRRAAVARFDRRAVVEACCLAASTDMLAEFTAQNALALETLAGDPKIQFRRLPERVIGALRKAAGEVLDAVAARDPFARRVWDSQRAFRERMRGWHAVSEVPYYQARG